MANTSRVKNKRIAMLRDQVQQALQGGDEHMRRQADLDVWELLISNPEAMRQALVFLAEWEQLQIKKFNSERLEDKLASMQILHVLRESKNVKQMNKGDYHEKIQSSLNGINAQSLPEDLQDAARLYLWVQDGTYEAMKAYQLSYGFNKITDPVAKLDRIIERKMFALQKDRLLLAGKPMNTFVVRGRKRPQFLGLKMNMLPFSATTDYATAVKFAQGLNDKNDVGKGEGVVFFIHMKKGQHALNVSEALGEHNDLPNEYEYLLKSGGSFLLRSAPKPSRYPNIYHVPVEYKEAVIPIEKRVQMYSRKPM